MDFAFIPSPKTKTKKLDPGILAAGRFFRSRLPPASIVPESKGNLEHILEWVGGKVPAGQQVGNLSVVSHASDHHVSFAMRPGQTVQTTYTELVKLKKAATFTAPAWFTAPVPSGGTPIGFAIKGCRVGSSEIFLRLLKSIFGGHVEVTAPQHYNGFIDFSNKAVALVLETLTYNIEVHRKSPITTFADLVDAFKARKFLRYDGSQIPDSEIEAVLEQLIKPVKVRTSDYLPTDKSTKQIKRPMRVTLKFNENVRGRKTHSNDDLAQLRTERIHRPIRDMNLDDFDAKPLMDHVTEWAATWEQDFGDPLGNGGKTFGESLGLDAGENLTTVIDWKAKGVIDKDSKAEGKLISGTYYRYQLLVPVTDVSDGTLLFDSQTDRGTPLATPTTWPVDATHRAALFRTL